jgi:hypothetical protein
MPDPNAIVALITRINPPADRISAAELLRQNPGGIAIELEGARAARLLPGDRAAGTLEILEQLRRMHAPVYLVVRPNTADITQLLIPLVTRVLKIGERGPDEMMVEFEASHARHLLKRNAPDYAELLATLRTAIDQRTRLVVTETDSHEIIDARLWPHEPSPSTEVFRERPPGLFYRIWHWFRCLFRCWCCVSPKRAQQLFDLMGARTCNPLTVPPPCIPFLYPDDGCWARAHEMCRLLLAEGVWPRKVWIDGNLHTLTKNNPNCYVDWGWHVAPTICVRWKFWHAEQMVIDPSLFTTPVTPAAWKGVQGDPSATLTPTDWTVYWRNVIPTDPAYIDTNIRLDYYRLQLKNRSLLPNGPPPYAFCP